MEFSFGRVINRTFSTLGFNPGVFFGLSFLITGLLGTISSLVTASATAALTTGDFIAGGLFMIAFGALVPIFAGALAQGALIFAAVESYKGRKASIGESLSRALPHLMPLIGIGILYALGVGLGFLLLIIPGVILVVLWSVAIPARVAEGTGLSGSFGRSRELVRGHFWPILGLLIVYMIIATVIGGILGAMGAVVSAESMGLISVVGTLIVSTVTGAIASSGVASLYYELRTVKDGASTDEVVEIFA